MWKLPHHDKVNLGVMAMKRWPYPPSKFQNWKLTTQFNVIPRIALLVVVMGESFTSLQRMQFHFIRWTHFFFFFFFFFFFNFKWGGVFTLQLISYHVPLLLSFLLGWGSYSSVVDVVYYYTQYIPNKCLAKLIATMQECSNHKISIFLRIIFFFFFFFFFLIFYFICYIGIRGTYQGLTPTIMKQGSNQAMRFFVMETLKDKYRGGDPNIKVPTLLTGLFGAVAGAVSVFGNTPIDVIKTRMQVRCVVCVGEGVYTGFSKGSPIFKTDKLERFYSSWNHHKIPEAMTKRMLQNFRLRLREGIACGGR